MDSAESVIEKIKKAIRLASRTDCAGERDTAMRLAKRLADNNGIALSEVDASAETARQVEGDEWRRMSGVEYGYACHILREHFAVVVMFNRRRSDGRTRLTWFGSPLNIDIAKHVWHILVRESNRAWSATRREARSSIRLPNVGWGIVTRSDDRCGQNKASFMRGFFFVIDQRLRTNPLRNDRDAFEAERREVERRFADFKRGNSVRDARTRKARMDAQAVAAGIAAGQAVNLARPCGDGSSGTLRLGCGQDV